MISNLLQKVLVSTTVGTVIGFSSIFGAASSAMAVMNESGEIYSPNNRGISNIVFYLQDSDGNITKAKIEGFNSEYKDENEEGYSDYQKLLNQPDYKNKTLVAYTVKAGKNKSGMGFNGREGDLFDAEGKPLDVGDNFTRLGGEMKARETYQYSNVSNLPAPKPQQPEDSTPIVVEDPVIPPDPVVTPTLPTPPTITIPPIKTDSSSQPVSVPEPGSIAAIAIFGLGGLLRKKKASS